MIQLIRLHPLKWMNCMFMVLDCCRPLVCGTPWINVLCVSWAPGCIVKAVGADVDFARYTHVHMFEKSAGA